MRLKASGLNELRSVGGFGFPDLRPLHWGKIVKGFFDARVPAGLKISQKCTVLSKLAIKTACEAGGFIDT